MNVNLARKGHRSNRHLLSNYYADKSLLGQDQAGTLNKTENKRRVGLQNSCGAFDKREAVLLKVPQWWGNMQGGVWSSTGSCA